MVAGWRLGNPCCFLSYVSPNVRRDGVVVCRSADSDELIVRVVISTCSMKCNDDFLRGRSFEVMVQVNELRYGGEERLEIPLVDNVGIINDIKITKLVSGKDALVLIGSFLTQRWVLSFARSVARSHRISCE